VNPILNAADSTAQPRLMFQHVLPATFCPSREVVEITCPAKAKYAHFVLPCIKMLFGNMYVGSVRMRAFLVWDPYGLGTSKIPRDPRGLNQNFSRFSGDRFPPAPRFPRAREDAIYRTA
jgi:hypothetical protein